MRVHIDKYTSPRNENFGRWYIARYEVSTLGIGNIVETICVRDTRKECVEYARSNGIEVDFIGSGRMPRGCKW